VGYPAFDPAGARNTPIPLNHRIGFDQHLGARIALGAELTDETGKKVALGSYFGAVPVVLALVYYGCPNLCTLTLNGLFKAMADLRGVAGREYRLIVLSIDPHEGPSLAREKREKYLRGYGGPSRGGGVADGIHFLTGSQAAIRAVTQAVGFRYVYDAEHRQYAHPAGLVVLTSEGRIARYLFGIDFPHQSLRLAIDEAGRRRIGHPIEAFLLFCYHYDPATGTYTFLVRRVLAVAGVATALGLFGIILWLLWLEARGRRVRPA
jgi:protein SCO1/2